MHVTIKLNGVSGLVMHNPQLADKRNPFTKAIAEITTKRKKTEADEDEIERLEWYGGLYYDRDIGVFVPTFAVIRCLENAAKITREGSTLVRALAVASDRAPVMYEGPRDIDQLWASPEYRFRKIVGVQRAKVPRMRPIFRRWRIDVEAELLEDVMALDSLRRVAELAGRSEGLLDARKLGMGRFSAEVVA